MKSHQLLTFTLTALISGFGNYSIADTLNIPSGGSFYIPSFDTFEIDGVSTNAGAITNDGQLFLSDNFTNLSQGSLNNNNHLTNNGFFTNDGLVNDLGFDASSLTNTTTGTFTNNGTVWNDTVNNQGVWHDNGFTNFETLNNTGTFNANTGFQLNPFQTMNNAGTLNFNNTFYNYGIYNGQAGSSLTNTGQIINENQFSSAGFLNNLAGRTIDNRGQFTNSGTFINDGSFSSNTLNSSLTNSAGGGLTNNSHIHSLIVTNHGIWNDNGVTSFETLNNTGTYNANNSLSTAPNQTINNAGLLSFNNVFHNYGIYNGQAGSSLTNTSQIINENQFSSAGFLHNMAGQSIENRGEFTNSGTFINDGIFNGSSNSLTNAAGGVITNNDRIQSVTINNLGIWQDNRFSTFQILNNSGVFNANNGINVHFNQAVNNAGQLNLANTSHNFGVINNQASSSVKNSGNLNNEGDLVAAGLFENTFGANIQNNGNFNNTGITTNNGTFNNTDTFIVAENSFFEGDGTFTQNGGRSIINGELEQAHIFINSGTLQGNGQISATSQINIIGAELNPGNSVGSVSFAGDTFFDGTINIEVESATSYDTVFFEDVTFGQHTQVNIKLDPLTELLVGQTIDFLFATNLASLNLTNISVLNLEPELSFNFITDGKSLSLALVENVPLPGSLVFFLSSLFAVRLIKTRARSAKS